MNAIKMLNEKINMDVINNFLELYLEYKNSRIEFKTLLKLITGSIAGLSIIYIG